MAGMGNTIQFKYQGLPTIEDPVVHEFSFIVQQIRSFVSQILMKIPVVNEPLHLYRGIPLSILNRLCEASVSIEILAMKSRTRDAGVLLASVFELRTDLCYMAQDTSRLETWAAHENTWRKPWKLHKQLEALFSSKGEREAEKSMYHKYCMIKHGSPAFRADKDNSDNFAYTVLVGEKQTGFRMRDCSHLLPTFLFGLGAHLYDAASAALKILDEHGQTIPDVQEQLDDAHDVLTKRHTRLIEEMVFEWVKRQKEGAEQ